MRPCKPEVKFPNRGDLRMSVKKSKPTENSQTSQIKSLIESNSGFFDTLVELIPPRFYLPTPDDERPWIQGLSKVAKASLKKLSRKHRLKNRKQKFNPENTSSTLELLQKDITKSKNVEEGAASTEDDHAPTYEELRQRLHKRIEELKGNRNTKVECPEGPRDYLRKRHRELEEEQQQEEGKKDEIEKKPMDDLTFGKLKGGDEERKRKKKKLTKYQELERAKKLVELKKDPEKGKKVLWKTAESRAMGEKVHDNPKMLKESIKKEKRRQKKSAEKWKDREETKVGLMKEKQQKRSDNIKERAQLKKMKKIEKREKKLMRPGFEGRKEGYINE